MAGRFSVEAVFKAADRITAPIARLQKRMKAFTDSAEKGMKSLDNVASKTFSAFKTGAKVAAASALAFGVALWELVGVGAQFDKTLVAAAAKFDPAIKRGTAGFEMLRKAAEDVGELTEFNAQQGAEALKELASAGFSAEQAVAALPGTVDLATAAELELGRASEIATKSLGAFGLVTEDTIQLGKNLARVTDVLQEAANKTSASMEGLYESIKEGAPVGVAAGASMETFVAMTASMAKASIEGSTAGTTLKNVFLAFAAPTAKAARTLRNLGVATKDGKGNLRDVIDILGDLEQKTAGMGTANRSAVLERIFGKIPIAGVAAMLDQGAGKLRELRAQLEASEGATAKMAKTMRDTVTGDIDGFLSAIDAVKIALFSTNNEGIRFVIQGMTEWVKKGKDFIVSGVIEGIKWFRDHMEKVVYWGGKLAAIAATWYAIMAAIKAASLAMAIFNAIANANPILLIAYAIIGALTLIVAFWPEISKFFSDVWDGVVSLAGKVIAAVGGIVSKAVGLYVSYLAAVWNTFKGPALAFIEFLVGLVTIIGTLIYRLIAFFVGPWVDLFNELLPIFLDVARTIGGFFVTVFGAVRDYVVGVFESIAEIAAFVADKLKTIWEPIATWFSDTVVASIKTGWGILSEFFSGLWTGIKDTFWSILGPVFEALSWGFNKVRKVGQGVLGTGGESGVQRPPPQVVSPSERASYLFEETSHTTQAEVTIRDQTGRATVTKAPKGPGLGLNLIPSGAM